MCQTEQVAGRRLTLSPPPASVRRNAPELDQPRLLRMPLQIERAHTCPQCAPEPFGVVPVCEADHEVVGVPHDDAISPGVLTPPAVGPEVQDVVQGDGGRHRAHTAPLWAPFLLRVPLSLFQHAGVPPRLHVAHDALGPNPMLDALHQPGGGDRIKAPPDVRLKHPVDVALLDAHRHCLQGIMGAAAGATSRGEPAKLPLVDGVEHLHRGPRAARIFQSGDADGPLAAIRLRDGHPLDRAGVVRPSLAAV